ncbi:MAG: hypothetical protein NTZ64_15115 [Polaromonas sp.]|nr:hypothetical protein [Polaromonas sp.]
MATPENTPVPGAGRWSWNAAARRWEDASDSQTATAAPIPTLE